MMPPSSASRRRLIMSLRLIRPSAYRLWPRVRSAASMTLESNQLVGSGGVGGVGGVGGLGGDGLFHCSWIPSSHAVPIEFTYSECLPSSVTSCPPVRCTRSLCFLPVL